MKLRLISCNREKKFKRQFSRSGQISELHIFAPPNAAPCTVPPGANAPLRASLPAATEFQRNPIIRGWFFLRGGGHEPWVLRVSGRKCAKFVEVIWSVIGASQICFKITDMLDLFRHQSAPSAKFYTFGQIVKIRDGMVIVWRLRGNIIRTAPCWVVWHNVHSQQHTHVSSSYRFSGLGLSHWDPYAVRRGGCLELYHCNMMEWSWWDSGLICKTN